MLWDLTLYGLVQLYKQTRVQVKTNAHRMSLHSEYHRLPATRGSSFADHYQPRPASGVQNCLALHHPLVECVFYDFWSGATEVEASNNADMRANDVSGAYPLFKVRIQCV
jgi:hypothetical protein